MDCNVFVFTYGTSENYPYRGGWTTVYAPDRIAAYRAFQTYHPNIEDSPFLNCASVYTLEDFAKTSMYKECNNFGAACHEVIRISREFV